VKNEAVIHDPLHAMLAHLIVDKLGMDAIRARELTPDRPLVGGSLGLNKLDVLEVAGHVEEQFDVSFNDGVVSQNALTSIASLATFIRLRARVSTVARLPELEGEFDETELMLPDGFRI